ncbi:hypothetical protein OS493_039377 [Desmophyllum pertusum]|uniref:Nephrocystin 3-like N-terminal domain-containing protein n=1 Tax=Desmophyllum pertusum TaxID=174260 RepID=A0A9W9ZWE6_9CNID|nr:hypothetical protein OS493_039377 [Desmophyllum pertusum]
MKVQQMWCLNNTTAIVSVEISSFEADIAFFAKRHDPDTRQWLFDDFDTWFHDPGDSRAYVTPWRSRSRQKCARSSPGTAHERGWTLRRCLLLPSQRWHKKRSQPLSKCQPSQQRKLVIIDALDETEYESREDLLDLIMHRFSLLPEWLVFFITSRPEDTRENSDRDEQQVIDAVSQFVVLRGTPDQTLTFLHNLIPAWLTDKKKSSRKLSSIRRSQILSLQLVVFLSKRKKTRNPSRYFICSRKQCSCSLRMPSPSTLVYTKRFKRCPRDRFDSSCVRSLVGMDVYAFPDIDIRIGNMHCFATSSDKKTVAGAKDRSLLFFDASTCTAGTVGGPFEISGDTIDKIDQLEFSPDGKFVFFGRLDKWFSVERGCVEDFFSVLRQFSYL